MVERGGLILIIGDPWRSHHDTLAALGTPEEDLRVFPQILDDPCILTLFHTSSHLGMEFGALKGHSINIIVCYGTHVW